MLPCVAPHLTFAYSDMVTSRILPNSLKTKEGRTVYSEQNQRKGLARSDMKLQPGAQVFRAISLSLIEPVRAALGICRGSYKCTIIRTLYVPCRALPETFPAPFNYRT